MKTKLLHFNIFFKINHSFWELWETFLLWVQKSSVKLQNRTLWCAAESSYSSHFGNLTRLLFCLPKKLSVVDNLHKETAWFPRRGFCTTELQHLVQEVIAEAAQGGLPFLLLPVPVHSQSRVTASLAFPGAHVSSGPVSWTHHSPRQHGWPFMLPVWGQDCLCSERSWALTSQEAEAFNGWTACRWCTSLNIVKVSPIH